MIIPWPQEFAEEVLARRNIPIVFKLSFCTAKGLRRMHTYFKHFPDLATRLEYRFKHEKLARDQNNMRLLRSIQRNQIQGITPKQLSRATGINRMTCFRDIEEIRETYYAFKISNVSKTGGMTLLFPPDDYSPWTS